MTPFRFSRLALGFLLAVLGVAVTAHGQPVPATPPVPVGPGGKKVKGKEKDDRDWTEAIHLPVLREAKQKIEAVNKYLDGKDPISAQRWDDIIGVLQGMLDDPTDNFVEIDGKGTKVSVRREVNRIIGTKFKKDGLEFYQQKVGPTADQKFKAAEDENDMLGVAEVSQRYLHSKAGAAATLRLAGWHLDRGRYMQAANTLKLFLLRDTQEALPPDLLFKAALTFKRAATDPDTTKQAQTYWDKFEKATNRADVTLNSKTLTFAQLKAEFDKAVPVGRMFSAEHMTFRQNPTNNGIAKGGTPFLEAKFAFDFLTAPEEVPIEVQNAPPPPAKKDPPKQVVYDLMKTRIDAANKVMETKGIATLPGSFPLASSGRVIFRGYDGVYCIATREDKTVDPPIKPGELLWKQDTESGLYQMMEMGKRTTTEQWLLNYVGGPFGILTENPLLGTLSHDGQHVYFVDDLAVPPHPNFWNNARMSGMQPAFGPFNDAAYASKLKAVAPETGKLMWKLGEATPGARKPGMMDPRFGGGLVEPEGFPKKGPVAVETPPVKQTSETFLADALFLGPPLPLAGKLYVVVEKDGLHLVCLDPGRLEPAARQPSPIPALLWTQKLGDPNGALPEDAMRRYQGIHLAYKDGVLVVPTNAGAVLGIDLFSHSLIWAAAYKSNKSTQKPVMNEEMMMRGGRGLPGGAQPGMSYDLTRERWHASAPIVVGTKVVFTAFDSDTVECVDLHDGRPAWKAPIAKLESDLYVAGVFDEKVLIVGKGYVRFHSLATGQQLRDPLQTGIPTGVGAATDGLYFLPIKASKDKSLEPGIVAIDYKAMQTKGTSRSRKKETAGNLLFHDGDLVSVTPSAVSGFQQLANKIAETEARLGKDPNDPIGLVDLAMLQHDDGRLVPAITNYQKALAGKPPEDLRAKGREKLFEAITELLQNDFAAGEKLLPEYSKLCTVEVPAGATDAQRKLLAEEELRRKSNFHALVAKGKETQGKLLEAFEAYMAYGTLVGNKEMVNVPDDPGTVARPDVWARARIQSMIKKATPEQRKPLEDKVVEEWTKVKSAADIEQLRGFVKVFGGMFEAGTEARITLADRLAVSPSEDDVREAEYMLLSVRGGEDKAAAGKAVEALARLYIRKGLLDDAVGMYAELGRKFATYQVRDAKTGAEFFSELVTDKRFLPYLEPPVVAWPYPKMRQGDLVSGGYDARAGLLTVDPGPDALPFFRRYRLSIASSNGWALRTTDRITGKDEYTTTPGMGYPTWQTQFLQNNMPYVPVQVKGHVAVVTMHSNNNNGGTTAKVWAYDLADKKKLWELDLLGASPNPALVNQPAINQAMEADGFRLTFQDGWSVLVGQTWVVEDTYTVVLTRDGLVAKDNARGTVLWTKTNVSPRTHLVGDGDHVFAYDVTPDGGVSPVRCYRAADGVEVSIPDSSGVFTTVKKARFIGRTVLVADDADAKKSVRLYDLFTGKDLWKHDLPGDGWVVKSTDDDYTGYVTAAGDVAAFAVADGKEVFRGKLDEARKAEHLAKVTEVTLFADADRVFVALSRPHEVNRFGYNPVFGQALRSVRVNGVMYAFDRKTARRLWHTAEQLEDMQVAVDQFADLPLFFAAANQMKMNANGGIEGQSQRFIAIDKATGKLKYQRSGQMGNAYSAILADPKTGNIEVMTSSGQRVRFVPDDGRPVAASEPVPEPKKGATTTFRPVQGLRLAPAVVAPPVVPPPPPKKAD